MNEELRTQIESANPAPEPKSVSKGQRWATALAWGVAAIVFPIATALGTGWLILSSLDADAGMSALGVLFIVPAVYGIIVAMLALVGFARSRQLGDGVPASVRCWSYQLA